VLGLARSGRGRRGGQAVAGIGQPVSVTGRNWLPGRLTPTAVAYLPGHGICHDMYGWVLCVSQVVVGLIRRVVQGGRKWIR
jgi:hypothetical protein